MAESKKTVPPHIAVKDSGVHTPEEHVAETKRNEEEHAAQERSRGMEEIMQMAQFGPISVQTGRVHLEHIDSNTMKLYQVYNIKTYQDETKNIEVFVRICVPRVD